MNEYLTYKALHGLAPPYLSDDVCWLRKSVDVCDQLFSWCTDMCGLVTGVFAVAGPRVWNSLPAPLRDTNSIYSFRKLLKTHLFSGGCRNYLFFLLLRGVQIFLLTYLLISDAECGSFCVLVGMRLVVSLQSKDIEHRISTFYCPAKVRPCATSSWLVGKI